MLNKDDAVQTDNVTFEGENEEANQAQFGRRKSDSRLPNKMIGCPSCSSTMYSREVKMSKTLLFEFNMQGTADHSGTY